MAAREAASRTIAGLRQQLTGLEQQAHGVADRLPDLVLEAERIAANVSHGIHGRRRAGTGETFWQFRQYASTDSAQLIDWRRSASSDQVFVREREWEAAHTIWLWPDVSKSMDFKSHLSTTTKRDRALVLMLALAELLVRSGERVALLGLTQPTAQRRAATRLAEAIAQSAIRGDVVESLPPLVQLSRFSGTVLFSDFLDPVADIAARVENLAANGVQGHLVQVLDPAEETLPYEGRTEFVAPEGSSRWIAERAEAVRPAYLARLAEHRAALLALTQRLGWSFVVHRTDRPASDLLLALIARLQGQDDGLAWASRTTLAATGRGTP